MTASKTSMLYFMAYACGIYPILRLQIVFAAIVLLCIQCSTLNGIPLFCRGRDFVTFSLNVF